MHRQFLLFLHLAGVIVWVGGMSFAYFCLRPAAARLLQPPERLGLWAATFASFFRMVAVAVVVILASGFAMFAETGFRLAPRGWYFMMAFGLAMALVFAYVFGVLYRRFAAHCAAAAWPAAAGVLNAIRRLVAVNLVLAICAVASAVSAR
jgi:uncharacterized membrane protein